MNNLKVMLSGVSGVGKTTLAKDIAKIFDLSFISGSYSDLVPETKEMSHQSMIEQDAKTVFTQDMQVVSIRNKTFRDKLEFITDRSYLDSAAYFINKLSHRIPQCDLEHALDVCWTLLGKQCTHLIYIPYSVNFLDNWVIEDNKKRIQSKYYQFQVSKVIDGILDMWGYKRDGWLNQKFMGIPNTGVLNIQGNEVKVLILDEVNYDARLDLVTRFLK